jgi:hypothetical protein
MTRNLLSSGVTALVVGLTGVSVQAAGQLGVFANGESLATRGFVSPHLTRDGWQLVFDRIEVTLAGVSALQTDPPFVAKAGGAPVATVTVPLGDGAPVTIDLTDTDEDGRVLLATLDAPPGHYNAVVWSVVPAPEGDNAGLSMLLAGTATQDGRSVDFTLTSDATHRYACGEYIGDARTGFLSDGGTAEVELTFHLDHVFGRADKALDDPINLAALGFDAFAGGGVQTVDLRGLHIGHVGEGHCAVTFE